MDHPDAGLITVVQYPNNDTKGMSTQRNADGTLDMIAWQLPLTEMMLVCYLTGAKWAYLPYEKANPLS